VVGDPDDPGCQARRASAWRPSPIGVGSRPRWPQVECDLPRRRSSLQIGRQPPTTDSIQAGHYRGGQGGGGLGIRAWRHGIRDLLDVIGFSTRPAPLPSSPRCTLGRACRRGLYPGRCREPMAMPLIAAIIGGRLSLRYVAPHTCVGLSAMHLHETPPRGIGAAARSA